MLPFKAEVALIFGGGGGVTLCCSGRADGNDLSLRRSDSPGDNSSEWTCQAAMEIMGECRCRSNTPPQPHLPTSTHTPGLQLRCRAWPRAADREGVVTCAGGSGLSASVCATSQNFAVESLQGLNLLPGAITASTAPTLVSEGADATAKQLSICLSW